MREVDCGCERMTALVVYAFLFSLLCFSFFMLNDSAVFFFRYRIFQINWKGQLTVPVTRVMQRQALHDASIDRLHAGCRPHSRKGACADNHCEKEHRLGG